MKKKNRNLYIQCPGIRFSALERALWENHEKIWAPCTSVQVIIFLNKVFCIQEKQSDAFSIFLVSCFSAGGGAISNGIQPAITHLYGNNLKSGKYRIPLKFYFCRCILPPKSNSPFPADEETDSISGSHNLTSPSLDRTPHSNSLKGPLPPFCSWKIWSYGCPAPHICSASVHPVWSSGIKGYADDFPSIPTNCK